MRKEAVQNERDQIKKKNTTVVEDDDSLSISTLLNAESQSRRRPTTTGGDATAPEHKIIASVNDVGDSMREQLLALVDWAKYIPAFAELPIDDQVALFRAHAGKNLVMGVARRSLKCPDVLLLGNNFIIPRKNESQPEINVVTERILDEIVSPLSELNLDDTEFACLKAMIFFNPADVRPLAARAKVKNMRRRVMCNLEDYINDRQYERRGRFGETLLLLPTLQAIASQMIEQIQFVKIFGVAKVDELLQEILLHGRNESPTTMVATNLPNNAAVTSTTSGNSGLSVITAGDNPDIISPGSYINASNFSKSPPTSTSEDGTELLRLPTPSFYQLGVDNSASSDMMVCNNVSSPPNFYTKSPPNQLKESGVDFT